MMRYDVKWNKLCAECCHKCKQNEDVKLVSCPKFEYKPKQLYLPFWHYKRYIKR